MNNRNKGAKGERELANILKEYGYNTRRGHDGRFKPKGNIFLTDTENIYCFTVSGELLFFTELENAQKIINLHWCKLADGYSSARVKGAQIGAHRFLANANDGELVDHKNRNKADNRLCNLRICNKSENAYNSKINCKNTSGHTGVWYRKDINKWSAEIKHNYKKINLGCFKTKEEAIIARKKAEIQYAKEYRRDSNE